MICNPSTQDGHQHAAEMRDDRLDREIRPFAPRAYTVHCRRIDHDRRHPVAAPQKENPAVEHGRRRMHVGESEEVKCRHQDKHREQDARAETADPPYDHPSGKRGEEPDECPRHSAHHPDLLHVVAQVDQPGFQHGERTDQAGIVKKEETDLFPDAPAGEEIDHICLFGPFVRILRLDADAFVEKEWQKGGDDEQRDARQQTVPADLLEEQEQDTAPDHRTSETSHRLHAVCKAFIFSAESEYRQRVGRDILRGGGDEGYDDQGDDRIEVRMEIKESDGEDQAGVDQFGRKNPPFIVARRHGMAVYHRRPEEFQDPGQLDQLEKPDGRE